MITVTLKYPNDVTQDVLLADVPRAGEDIRLSNGADSVSLLVEHVLHVEGRQGVAPPIVVVTVRPRPK